MPPDTGPHQTAEPLPEGLQDAREAWQAAANASDPLAYAALLAEDAVWLPPGMAAIEGRTAIRVWLAEVMGGLSYELELADVEVRVAGTWASEQGRFTSQMTDQATGEASTHEGAYLILWRQGAKGRWRIDRYVDLST